MLKALFAATTFVAVLASAPALAKPEFSTRGIVRCDDRYPVTCNTRGWFDTDDKQAPPHGRRSHRRSHSGIHHQRRPLKRHAVQIAAIPLPVPRPAPQPQPEPQPAVEIAGAVAAPAVVIQRVTEAIGVFARYAASLVRPVGNCRGFSGLDPKVKAIVASAAKHFGGEALAVSCYRSRAYNAAIYRARGRRPTNSAHIRHKAIDFRIAGVSPQTLIRYLRPNPQRKGIGLYCGSSFIHVDTDATLGRREWAWGCGGRHFRTTKKPHRQHHRRRYARA